MRTFNFHAPLEPRHDFLLVLGSGERGLEDDLLGTAESGVRVVRAVAVRVGEADETSGGSAAERLLAGVEALVGLQLAALGESFRAPRVITNVRLFT